MATGDIQQCQSQGCQLLDELRAAITSPSSKSGKKNCKFIFTTPPLGL